MGCCASVEESDSVGKLRNEEIDGQLRMEKINNKNEVKLLLLGMFCLFSCRENIKFISLIRRW